MDSFELVVAAILHRRGYWTQTCVKVELTTAEKRRIGRPSSPRWELDVVAYNAGANELLIVECKSFLDSPGVQAAVFRGKTLDKHGRYKLFTEPVLRRMVFAALVRQFTKKGFCRVKPRVVLALAAGKVNGDVRQLQSAFETRGWQLIGPSQIAKDIRKIASEGYENSTIAVVTKILERNRAAGE